ncbi:MAG TPA: DedA family protein [Acidothermaceae bacterium]|nr:DedA family protein [Acidothermaceae bacterium]
MTGLVEHILRLPSWIALLVVFAMPALEASTFLGFIFPGEIACLLGGVLASESKVSLAVVVVVAAAGAVIGDSVGFAVGYKYGDALLNKVPVRIIKPEHVVRTKELIVRLGGRAVFVGRFTAALRALVPGFAGVSKMHYRTFLIWNFAGGTLWATGVVVAGYLAGKSWHRVASDISIVGWVVLGLVIVIGVIWFLRRRRRSH